MVRHVQDRQPAGVPTGGQFTTTARNDSAVLQVPASIEEFYDSERDVLYLSGPVSEVRKMAAEANRFAEKTVLTTASGGKDHAVLVSHEKGGTAEFEVHGFDSADEVSRFLDERGMAVSGDGMTAHSEDDFDLSAKLFQRASGEFPDMVVDAEFVEPKGKAKAAHVAALKEARAFLRKLNQGDLVLVTKDGGKEQLYEVSRPLHLQDGNFGHPDNAKVTLRIVGGHGYAFDVSPDGLSYGFGASRLRAVHKGG